jgi:hypothetical protein
MSRIEKKPPAQKRPSNTSKHEFFLLLWVIFALLDPDPDPYSNYGSGSNGPIEYGSNTDPDPGSGSTTLDLRPINPEGCTILYIVHMGDLSILIF